MSDLALFLIFFFGPVLLLCLVAWVWSGKSRVPRLAVILRRSALFWAGLMLLVFAYFLLAPVACNGDPVYGYTQCRVMPEPVADASLMILALSLAAGLIYATLLFLIGGIIEWRRRGASSNGSESAP